MENTQLTSKTTPGIAPNDGLKSRKFLMAFFSSFGLLAYACVARACAWVSEPTLEYLTTTSLVAISVYCGFNIVEKIGTISSFFRPQINQEKKDD